MKVIDVIVSNVDNDVDNRFISLAEPFKVIKNRIYKRCRNGEEKLKIEQLKMYSI